MKHKLNSKVIATGLFNVADQNDDLDKVRDALRTLNHIVIGSGQFSALVQSKKMKGQLKVEILNSVLGKLSHPLVNEVVSYLKGSSAAIELKEISTFFESMYAKKSSTIEVKGIVASKMSDQQIESFKASLDEILGKKTKLSIEVDPESN
jgi:F0F1-type ATP synthase, delta subunit (mitochondrial oligomycin sensitivity protein)